MTLKRSRTSFELSLSLFMVSVMVLGAVVLAVIPEIKTFQILKDAEHKALENTRRLQREYDRLYRMKEAIDSDTQTDRLESPSDSAAVEEWITGQLPAASVKPAEGPSAVLVESRFDTPMAFYDFLDHLGSAPWLLRADENVSMEAQKGGVVVTFTLTAGEPPQK